MTAMETWTYSYVHLGRAFKDTASAIKGALKSGKVGSGNSETCDLNWDE